MNDSQEYRAECEARWLASRTVQQIEAFLALVAEKRNQAASDSLRTATRQVYLNNRRAA